ncbi:hypothetical protein BDV18DRAFT_72044 [Aspergillus unguis]
MVWVVLSRGVKGNNHFHSGFFLYLLFSRRQIRFILEGSFLFSLLVFWLIPIHIYALTCINIGFCGGFGLDIFLESYIHSISMATLALLFSDFSLHLDKHSKTPNKLLEANRIITA